MATFLLYLVALTIPAPALALLAVRINVLSAVRKTYFFWSGVSLLNFSFLAFLPFPLLLLIPGHGLGKFLAFLLPPACAAAVIVLVMVFAVRVALRGKAISEFAKLTAPYLVNFVFFVAFVGASDIYKNHLIDKELISHAPSCMYVSSFLSSLMNAGRDMQFHVHAIFVEGGRNYYWSYSEMTFFEGNDRLDPNFLCQKQ